MKIYTLAAIALIVAGVLALVYGQITYTSDAETANLGPLELTVSEKGLFIRICGCEWAQASAQVYGIRPL